MARKNFKVRANSGRGFYRPASGELTYTLGRDLMTSLAWGTLSFSARLVLLDFVQFYYRKSSWESQSITDTGLEYTYAVCDVVGLSESAFLRARKALLAHGFLVIAEHIKQSRRPCSAIRFNPSDAWRDYPPTKDESADLERWRTSRTNRIERGKANRAKAISYLSGRRTKQNQGVKKADKHTVKKADKRKDRDAAPTVKNADIQTDIDRQNGGHLIYTGSPARVSAAELTRFRRTPRWYQVKARRKMADLDGRKADLGNVESIVAARVIASGVDHPPTPLMIWRSVGPSLPERMLTLVNHVNLLTVNTMMLADASALQARGERRPLQ